MAKPDMLAISPADPVLDTKEALDLRAELTRDGAAPPEDVTAKVQWSSSDESLAAIERTRGKLVAKDKAGTVKITARLDEKTFAETTVTVRRVLDLTAVELPGDEKAAAPHKGPVTEHWNQDRDQEDTRSQLAKGLVWILFVIVVGAFVTAWTGAIEPVLKVLQVVFGPIVALVGSAVGFYFAVRSQSPPGGQNNTPPSNKGAPKS
jgi:hypothetical protein